MSLHRRAPLPLRILGAAGSCVLGAYIAAQDRRWNSPPGPPPRRARLPLALACAVLLLLTACAVARPWVAFQVPGVVVAGKATERGADLYVLVGARVIPVPVARSVFDRFRRGDAVTVTGEARGDRLRRVAVLVASGTAV